eukprot:TRINITY_DN2322_c0_g2_i1.p1 TRINITY_DN2322_c0_g2~~TRINITY_DN2322_c0_g2_i1.p1  ORF type:complete len:391 (-),score=77.32 TRINITY_DN2322_c0_g2_i1:52-1224(-)
MASHRRSAHACAVLVTIIWILHDRLLEAFSSSLRLCGRPTSSSGRRFNLQRKALPASSAGVRLSRLGVGTWQWGNQLLWGYDTSQDAGLQEVFDRFVAGGATWFDTGDSYGTGELEGRAESLLGQFSAALKERGGPDVVLATKLAAYPWRLTPESMVEAVKKSNERIGRPVDMAQMHWSPRSYAFGFQEDALLEGLCRCYEDGLCKAVGLSNFGPKGLRRAAKVFEGRGVPLVSNQVQYSLLSAERATGIADTCKELGVKLVAYSPLCLGLLTGKYGPPELTGKDGWELPGNPLRAFLFSQLLSDRRVQDLVQLLKEIGSSRNRTAAQVALNWALEDGGGCTIVGARDIRQVDENLAAVDGWSLEPAELEALNAAASKAPKTQRNPFFSD